ncbi:MAG: beta-ketoacyl-ACP synthase III [Bacteroidales bacterium]
MMLKAKISGIASYLPDYRLTNDELSTMVDTNDEWITTRVGIKERRILKGETVGASVLGTKAVAKLMAETGVNLDEIDMLVCATSTGDYRFPSTASVIVGNSKLKNANAYDIQAACSGFLEALQLGTAYIISGIYKKVLVVAAEMMSSMTNYTDRATCPLFGDGAAAVLLEPTTADTGVVDSVFKIDGTGLPYLLMKAGGSAKPTTHETVDAQEHFIYQEGRTVYKNAVNGMLEATNTVLSRNNLSLEDVDWFIPHQANLRIIEAVGSRVGIDTSKILVNITNRGNTSAASIPICMDEFKDKFKKGDKIVLTAFGAGFTFGSVYLIWDI